MDSEIGIQLFILLLLIGGSAFFSMSETALMSLTQLDVRHMVAQKVKGAKLLEKLEEDTTRLLGTILVGNNLINIGASALATVVATDIFGSAGVGIATGVMTLFVLIFGELTPKSIATKNPQRVALFVSKPIYLVMVVVSPVVKVLMAIANVLIRLLGGEVDGNSAYITADKLKTIVTVGHEEGVLEQDEKEMIYNVFNFGESYAKDIMIPRTDIVAVDIDATYAEVLDIFNEHHFSRMPVFKESHDNIVGMLYIKDLLKNTVDLEQFTVSAVLREAYFIHEFTRIDKLFDEMRSKKIGMAFVVDEYGGTSGLITVEDLIEEIVGEIHDEYDIQDEDFSKISEWEYLIDGAYRIDDLNDRVGLKLVSNEFDSVGGYVIGLLDRFPEVGETVKTDYLTFVIEEADNKRINKVRLRINQDVLND